MKKKTPKEIHEQWVRIFDYISIKDWENYKPSDDIYKRHGVFLEKLKDVAWEYIDNIYKLAGVLNRLDCTTEKANAIWHNFKATKAQYAK